MLDTTGYCIGNYEKPFYFVWDFKRLIRIANRKKLATNLFAVVAKSNQNKTKQINWFPTLTFFAITILVIDSANNILT